MKNKLITWLEKTNQILCHSNINGVYFYACGVADWILHRRDLVDIIEEIKEDEITPKINFDICEVFNISSYMLTVRFERAARKAGMDEFEIKQIVREALSKDNTHMLQTLLRYCQDGEV